ncbi:hypothetical protein EIN_093670 [Entamoeba invadens IP1]|uniref:Uncharacterized protein n=1 Tax=Entamoeba invadens IP1 TaxID=370355 RepID=A0A0A1TZY7_ENTIV|nr:hypothetical protein EIN_093670 [Entamoeba invadens IP1]ELP87210.1 hypothetical protein EIN_093670 [Entamoeba invadens IP1]|eukprot:XP_004253981.1 hypothetical protein EIN_093670 [Entamoeba invadens IP1]
MPFFLRRQYTELEKLVKSSNSDITTLLPVLDNTEKSISIMDSIIKLSHKKLKETQRSTYLVLLYKMLLRRNGNQLASELTEKSVDFSHFEMPHSFNTELQMFGKFLNTKIAYMADNQLSLENVRDNVYSFEKLIKIFRSQLESLNLIIRAGIYQDFWENTVNLLPRKILFFEANTSAVFLYQICLALGNMTQTMTTQQALQYIKALDDFELTKTKYLKLMNEKKINGTFGTFPRQGFNPVIPYTSLIKNYIEKSKRVLNGENQYEDLVDSLKEEIEKYFKTISENYIENTMKVETFLKRNFSEYFFAVTPRKEERKGDLFVD